MSELFVVLYIKVQIISLNSLKIIEIKKNHVQQLVIFLFLKI